MPLYGELFLNDVIEELVFDPKGEVLGGAKDMIVVKGAPLLTISASSIER